MARSKPSTLSSRRAQPRVDDRTEVNIAGRCRAGDREVQEVLVVDLAAGGCRMFGLSAGVTKSDPLAMWFGDAGPFAARLKWVKRGLFGVEFDEPIDERLLESLAGNVPGPKVVPLRRNAVD